MSKYRNEYKHLIPLGEAIACRNRLKAILQRDPHADASGTYTIRSLYFDTQEDKALYEKLNGEPFREKFRLRYYDQNSKMIKLEKKCKHFSKSSKSSITLTQQEAENIIEGKYQSLEKHPETLAREFYLKLRTQRLLPKTIVEYEREAFLFDLSMVRITLDSHLRSSSQLQHFFDLKGAMTPVCDPGTYILEVKFNEFLPEFIQDLVQINRCSSSSASKYAACRLYH
jgi:hypothetical protein